MLSSSCFSYLLIVGKHVWRPLLLDDRQMAGAIDQYITPLIFLHIDVKALPKLNEKGQ